MEDAFDSDEESLLEGDMVKEMDCLPTETSHLKAIKAACPKCAAIMERNAKIMVERSNRRPRGNGSDIEVGTNTLVGVSESDWVKTGACNFLRVVPSVDREGGIKSMTKSSFFCLSPS